MALAPEVAPSILVRRTASVILGIFCFSRFQGSQLYNKRLEPDSLFWDLLSSDNLGFWAVYEKGRCTQMDPLICSLFLAVTILIFLTPPSLSTPQYFLLLVMDFSALFPPSFFWRVPEIEFMTLCLIGKCLHC